MTASLPAILDRAAAFLRALPAELPAPEIASNEHGDRLILTWFHPLYGSQCVVTIGASNRLDYEYDDCSKEPDDPTAKGSGNVAFMQGLMPLKIAVALRQVTS